jgi:hypothetical protein
MPCGVCETWHIAFVHEVFFWSPETPLRNMRRKVRKNHPPSINDSPPNLHNRSLLSFCGPSGVEAHSPDCCETGAAPFQFFPVAHHRRPPRRSLENFKAETVMEHGAG